MSDSLTQQIADYVAREILKQPKRKISENEPLISSGLIDSFHLVDVALFVESQFGARLDDTELNADTFDTIEQLAGLIRQRV